MNKVMSRAAAVLMAVAVALSAMAFSPATAQAATRDAALKWLSDQVGKSYDIDGIYGVQCSDFASAYINWLSCGDPYNLKNFTTLNGYQYFYSMAYPDGWVQIKNSATFVPQAGDILCFDRLTADGPGHVAIADEGCTLQDAKVIQQNGVQQSKGVHRATIYGYAGYGAFLGVIRPKYDTAAPASMTVTVSKAGYTTAEDVVINWTAYTGADHYGLTVRNADTNAAVYENYHTGNSVNIGKLKAGNYRFSMAPYAKGEYDKFLNGYLSPTVTFKVTEAPAQSPAPSASPVPSAEPSPTPSAAPSTEPTADPNVYKSEDGVLTATVTAVGVKFDWKWGASPYGYRIYRSEYPGGEGLSISDFPIEGNDFVDVNVEPDTQYYYTIKKVLAEAKFDEETVTLTSESLSEASAELAVETRVIILEPPTSTQSRHFILMTLGSPTMRVDEKQKQIDAQGTAPMLVNNRTLVPIRAIIEEMGGTADWNNDERKVTLTTDAHKLEMWLDSKDIVADGVPKTVDVAPQAINGRTMLPIRFVAENVDCQAEWIGSTRQIIIVFYR